LTGIAHFDISTIIESREAPMQSDDAVRALAALAQDHRLAAFRLLVQAGAEGLAAGVLADRLGVPPSSLSFHLAQLAGAGLIVQQRHGRSLVYSADYAAMGQLMTYLTENCCGGVQACAPGAGCNPSQSDERNVA
jgi:ArsR family transcriptional regulator, arsenate/arsenite/antimonite-responsive transcriptional repressor